jgi:TPR repeat protein
MVRFVIAVMAVLCAAEASGNPLDDGRAAALSGDYATALKLLIPLATSGDAAAQAEMGTLYQNGLGVPASFVTAATWFERAADQGNPDAQFALGILYWRGVGVRENLVMAHMWLSLAAAQGDAIAAASRDLIAEHMASGQIASAEHLARDWKPKAGAATQ